jgi:hypothetical protein
MCTIPCRSERVPRMWAALTVVQGRKAMRKVEVSLVRTSQKVTRRLSHFQSHEMVLFRAPGPLRGVPRVLCRCKM